MPENAFREVTQLEFKETYFRLGGGPTSGWTADHWQKVFEEKADSGWRYMVQDPTSPDHNSMWIVTDNGKKEYLLFFLTEKSTENAFDFPGRE